MKKNIILYAHSRKTFSTILELCWVTTTSTHTHSAMLPRIMFNYVECFHVFIIRIYATPFSAVFILLYMLAMLMLFLLLHNTTRIIDRWLENKCLLCPQHTYICMWILLSYSHHHKIVYKCMWMYVCWMNEQHKGKKKFWKRIRMKKKPNSLNTYFFLFNKCGLYLTEYYIFFSLHISVRFRIFNCSAAGRALSSRHVE